MASGVNTIRQIQSRVINAATPLRSPSRVRSQVFSGWKITARIAAHKIDEK